MNCGKDFGRFRWLGLGRQLETREVADEILLALQQMVEAKTGALIVVERDIGLLTFTESGVAMDALVSTDLLCSIFEPRGTLHDGAVIIQGDRLTAAACFLPLTTNPVMLRRMGTRHRAAIVRYWPRTRLRWLNWSSGTLVLALEAEMMISVL